MIRAVSLFSGSKGNCTLVSSKDTHILIDAGQNAKKIKEGLSLYELSPADISAIFITHEHCDHIAALPVLVKKCNAAVHIAEPSFNRSKIAEGTELYEACVVRDEKGFCERVGNLTVTALPVSHDSATCMAYVIEDAEGDRFAICTDMGYVNNALAAKICGVRQAIIESNHDEEMLINGDYPQPLKDRILGNKGHLSNRVSAMLAVFLAKNGTQRIMLGHLSENNNTPEAAYEAVHNALLREGLSPRLTVSSQYEAREV